MTEHDENCSDTEGIDVFTADGCVWIHIGADQFEERGKCVNFGFQPDDALRFATAIAHAGLNAKTRRYIHEEAAKIAAAGMVPDDIRPEDIIGKDRP